MENVLIVLISSFCTALPFLIGQRHGVARLVSPMHLLAYFSFFGFLVKAVAYAFVPQLGFASAVISTPGASLRGALYLGLFIILLCLGYLLGCQRADPLRSVLAARAEAAGVRNRGFLFASAIIVTGFTVALILRARGEAFISDRLLSALNSAKQINVNASGVGATLAGIKTLFIIPKFAFVLFLAHGIVTHDRCSQACAAALAVLLAGVALISGDRFELIELFGYVAITFLMVGGRPGVQTMFRGGLLLGGFILVSAYMTSLRFGGQPGAGLVHQIIGSTYFLDLNAAIMVTDKVDQTTMMWGESYGWWTFGWVPRALWVDKPAIDLGVYFKRDVMQFTSGGAFNVTGPGEAFINFGWGGLGVALVLGWLYRTGEVALVAGYAAYRAEWCFLYPILFYPFVQATLQSSFSAFIVTAAAQAVVIWPLLRFCLSVPTPLRARHLARRRHADVV